MKKILKKIFILSVPLISYFILVAVVPDTNFSFRSLEHFKTNKLWLKRFFYPELSLERVEEGNLGHHTQFGIKRKVYWETDQNGFRNPQKFANRENEIFLLGDSFLYGQGVDQDELLVSQLNEQGFLAYSMADSTVNTFLNHRRINQSKAKWVILLRSEEHLSTVPDLDVHLDSMKDQIIWSIYDLQSKNTFVKSASLILDKFFKNIPYNSFYAAIQRWANTFIYRDPSFYVNLVVGKDQKMLFLRTTDLYHLKTKFDEKFFVDLTQRLKTYHEEFQKRGIHFVFIPIPNKGNIYRDQFSVEERNQFGEEMLPRLFVELKKQGVPFLDILTPFKSNKEKSLYQLDDSHWGPEAIKITASQIASMIK